MVITVIESDSSADCAIECFEGQVEIRRELEAMKSSCKLTSAVTNV